MKLEFRRQIFEKKNSGIKFHESPVIDNRIVPCGSDRSIPCRDKWRVEVLALLLPNDCTRCQSLVNTPLGRLTLYKLA